MTTTHGFASQQLFVIVALLIIVATTTAHEQGGHWVGDVDIFRLQSDDTPSDDDDGGARGVDGNGKQKPYFPPGADTNAANAAATEGGGAEEGEEKFISRYVFHDKNPGRWSWGDYVAHAYTLTDPFRHFSVLPPVHGCTSGELFTPRETSEYYATMSAVNENDDGDDNRGHGGRRIEQFCDVATNGGFFDPSEDSATFGQCLGPVVSNGNWEHRSPRKNAMFGLGTDPSGQPIAAVGYINETQMAGYKWEELVSGVGWLVRDGKSYIMNTLSQENYTTQTSGSGSHFIALKAPRLALGLDYASRVVLVAVDGSEPDSEGVSLTDLAEILVSLGVESAINLDGGGSVSVFDEDVLVNVPSDTCDVSTPTHNGTSNTGFPHFKCARKVASVICLQDAEKRAHFQRATRTPTATVKSTLSHTREQSPTRSRTLTPSEVLATPQPTNAPPPETDAPTRRPGTAADVSRSKARTIALGVLGVVLLWVLGMFALRCCASRKRRRANPELGPVEVPTEDEDEVPMDSDTIELHRI